jgi:hypothetical protein
MNERYRELAFVAVGLLLIAVGVGFDALAIQVEEPEEARIEGGISARAVFCPPTSAETGSALRISGAAVGGDTAVGLEPDAATPVELVAGTSFATKLSGREASEVVGYGHPVAAAGLLTATGPVSGAAASGCSPLAATEWFFAAGSAALDSDERILLYNPFPDEAVVRLSFYTPRGLETRTSLQDIPVPARSWIDQPINEAIRVRGTVGARVVAKRGRVVAWREMFTKAGDRPRSAQLSLGTPATSGVWYFADGAIGPRVDESVSLLNPEGREAIVSVAMTTASETLQPEKLLEFGVPRRSAVEIPLEDFVKEPEALTGASVIVKSVNGVEVAAERTVSYTMDVVSGAASEAGSTAAHESWLLPPAAAAAADDAVVLLNASASPIVVDLSVLGRESSREPASLQGIKIPPGRRVRVSVEDVAGNEPVAVLARGSEPFVAERYAYSRSEDDVSVVRGLPVDPEP